MEITTRNLIDIERYTNDIRNRLLIEVKEFLHGAEQDGEPVYQDIEIAGIHGLVASSFDRAIPSVLFKHLTSDQSVSAPEPVHGPLKSSKKSSGKGSGGPKPGSAAAKARAAKASQTRAANKAARAASDSDGNGAAPVGSASRLATGFGGTPLGSGGAV